ncbi:hypothetical protein GO755_26415 [Spirosoma sp. HMF4905]|uniref:Uncharacterized protein n=1 Tax=Spirosoma arboris TaxID=2682092 RepID=A0A7K1SIG3_9BACT|nr:hypothetical protein [Spirosoma arboris]MVM33600.1 hypothetical protein [Spirosoma arboris]
MRQFLLISAFWAISFISSAAQTITLTPTAIKSPLANTSGLSFTNLKSTSPAATSNGKQLSVDASGNVILTLDANAATQNWQLTGNDIANTNPGSVKVTNLLVGNASIAVAGTIRWNGTNFEGYNGSSWILLTPTDTPVNHYTTAVQAIGNTYSTQPCQTSCANIGCTSTVDSFGTTCQGQSGEYGNSAPVVVGTGYRCYKNNQDKGVLAQCLCRCPK